MHKIIAFLRRSTAGQGMSLEGQKAYLENWMPTSPLIKDLGIELNISRFVEFTGSGARMGAALKEILDDIDLGKNDYKYILIERLDRFHGRMGLKLLPHLQMLAENGVFVVIASENRICNDFSSLLDEILTPITLAVSRDESRKLSARVTERQKLKTQRGRWNGGIPLFGYARMEVSPSGEDVGILPRGTSSRKEYEVRLVLDEKRKVEAIRKVFENYAYDGCSLRDCAKWLHDNGFKTSRGNRWNVTTFHDMLRSVLYKGDQIWGRRRHGKFSQDENNWGDVQDSWFHDECKWETYHHEDLRIISEDLWEATQARIALKRPRPTV